MWILFAFISATLLGLYDAFKKQALNENAVMPVLALNTTFCTLLFLPLLILSYTTNMLDGTMLEVGRGDLHAQLLIMLKSVIVLSSWICGYFAMKHLPLTIVGPINATRPVMTLVGALLIFGERLNLWQWIGVTLAAISFMLLKKSSKKEGIDFKHDVWIYLAVGAAMLGAASGCYDKYLMAPVSEGGAGLDRMLVQSCYNIYQMIMMGIVVLTLWWPRRKTTTPFRWDWSIIFVSLFLSIADFAYFYALSLPGAMISIVSMVRRSSVIVSFMCGAFLFKEKNRKSKAIDLLLILIGMIFLWLGSR